MRVRYSIGEHKVKSEAFTDPKVLGHQTRVHLTKNKELLAGTVMTGTPTDEFILSWALKQIKALKPKPVRRIKNRQYIKDLLEKQITDDYESGDTTVLAAIISEFSDEEIFGWLDDTNQEAAKL